MAQPPLLWPRLFQRRQQSLYSEESGERFHFQKRNRLDVQNRWNKEFINVQDKERRVHKGIRSDKDFDIGKVGFFRILRQLKVVPVFNNKSAFGHPFVFFTIRCRQQVIRYRRQQIQKRWPFNSDVNLQQACGKQQIHSSLQRKLQVLIDLRLLIRLKRLFFFQKQFLIFIQK